MDTDLIALRQAGDIAKRIAVRSVPKVDAAELDVLELTGSRNVQTRKRMHAPVTLVVETLLVELAIKAARNADPANPLSRIGAAWEAANEEARITVRGRRTVQRRSGTLNGLRLAAVDGAALVEQEDTSQWHANPPGTPYDELEACLRREWLKGAIEALPEREAQLLRLTLGTEDEPVPDAQAAGEYGISTSRVAQIVTATLERLSAAWRNGLEQCEMRLNGTVPEPLPIPAEELTEEYGIVAQRRALGGRRRKAPPAVPCSRPAKYPDDRQIALADGVLTVGDHVVQRVGELRYLIDGAAGDLAAIAYALHRGQVTDAEGLRACRRIARHDTDLADELRSLIRGASWPTIETQRRTLPLT